VQPIKNFPLFFLLNPKVHCRIHKSPPLVLIMRERSIQFKPSPHISLGSISILSAHPCLGFLISLFPSGFPTNNLYAFISPHSCYISCPSHSLDLRILETKFHLVYMSEHKMLLKNGNRHPQILNPSQYL
jgi:hypothetical protein